MRTAATSGKWDGTSACTALPGWRAQGSAVGAVRSVVLGVASNSASCMCAPPLLKRIVVVGGMSRMPQRGMSSGSWRARRRAWSAAMRIAAFQLRIQSGCTGRGGGLEEPGYSQLRFTGSNRRGARMTGRHISASRAMWCWSGLKGATRDLSAARPLQPSLRRHRHLI